MKANCIFLTMAAAIIRARADGNFDQPLCGGIKNSDFNSAIMTAEKDAVTGCAYFKCKNKSAYFTGDPKTGSVDYSKCLPCKSQTALRMDSSDPTRLIIVLENGSGSNANAPAPACNGIPDEISRVNMAEVQDKIKKCKEQVAKL